MTAGSLFTGCGGFDLGMEQAGFEIKWQVEKDGNAKSY
jgi:DNA (cytosine-5)-methyltransferase 1